MLFLACAACDKSLNYDSKRCSACKVRYCSKECHDTTLKCRRLYAKSLYLADAASRDDVAKATTILEDVARTARRRASYEYAVLIQAALEEAREKLASVETKRRRSTRTQAALEAAVLAM